MRARLIINPISGTRNKRGLDRYVTERLAAKGFDIDAVWTTCRGDATRLATEARDLGYDAVIAAGGDGTINETARALCGGNVTFGIIPCGSGNGLARHIGIPVDIRDSVTLIEQGIVKRCDYGTVNDHEFFCTFGAGFDAAVSEKFAAAKHRGRMTYIRKTFHEFVSHKPEEYVISCNGEVLTERAFLVAVCNASQYGNNAYIAPHASITDGQLDLTIVHYGNLMTRAIVGADLMMGYLYKNMLVHTIRTTEVTIKRKAPGPIHIDGEPMTAGEELVVKCHPASLPIFVNEDKEAFRPIITPMKSMMRDMRYAVRHLLHPQ